MKNSKLFRLWSIIFLLVSCSTQETPTTNISITPTLQSLEPLPTFEYFPTPTPTILPTAILLATPNVTPKTQFKLDRLRMVVAINGNLYLQNNINPPIQLTYDGKDHDPIISNEGAKIVFYRGEAFDSVYSINADGSQEQAIIASQSLPILGRGDIRALKFIPNTHILLFNTYLCNPSMNLYNAPDCVVGIYSVDADSGEINELISGLSGNGTQTRNFEISPDGRYISVASSGHIDIYSLSTQSIAISQPDTISYDRTIPDEFLPLQYWLPDSSGLIAVLPTDLYNEPATPPHTFASWRYTMTSEVETRTMTQIPLDPPIGFNSACNFSVSPDRNWIFYISDRVPSLYLGNLRDSLTKPLEWKNGCPSLNYPYEQWSPDSLHFAWQNTIVTTDGEFIFIEGDFSGWLDGSHYFYVSIEENRRKIYVGKINEESIPLPEWFQLSPAYVILGQ